jgi:hypothetical protein
MCCSTHTGGDAPVNLDHKMHFSEADMSQRLAVFPIRWSSEGCPRDADDIAEAYWMGLLSQEAMRSFMSHSCKCPRCNEISEQAREFVSELTHVGHSRAAA